MPPTTAPVSVPLDASFLTETLPSESLVTTAVSLRWSLPSFSSARTDPSAASAWSAASKVMATNWDIWASLWCTLRVLRDGPAGQCLK